MNLVIKFLCKISDIIAITKSKRTNELIIHIPSVTDLRFLSNMYDKKKQ